mmetsp:Transcript_21902/g.56349  ORF Transcript_21902/g.56349 Transcript_21902/m.56349 type:complete len:147 (-) Transcript_21902:111-551(-)
MLSLVASALLTAGAGFVPPGRAMPRVLAPTALRSTALHIRMGADDEYSLATVAAEVQSGSAQLLDVRERGEWDEGHLPDALLVPLSMLQEGIIPPGVDLSKRIYCHCKKGGRAAKAEGLLKELGADDVTGLREGYEVLVKEGFDRV